MGVNFSKRQYDVITEVVNKSLTQVCTDIQNTVSAYTNVTQSIRVVAKDHSSIICKKGFTLEQSTSSNVSVMQKAFSSNDVSTQTKIANTITAAITDTLKQNNSELNLGQANIGVAKLYSETKLTNDVLTSFKNAVTQNVSATVGVSQSLDVVVEDATRYEVDGKCNWTNTAVTQVIIDTAMKSLMELQKVDLWENDVSQSLDGKWKQSNEGINPLLLFGGIFGGLFFVIIIIIIIVVVMKSAGGGKK